jgi:hypothetical protein
VYNASTKIPSDVVTGNIQQLRNYDQCLSIKVRNSDLLEFRGQQCRATVRFEVEGGSRDIWTTAGPRRLLDMKDLFFALAEAEVSDLQWRRTAVLGVKLSSRAEIKIFSTPRTSSRRDS